MKILIGLAMVGIFLVLNIYIKLFTIKAIETLSQMDKVRYVIYMIFSLTCLLLTFKHYNLPFLQDYSILIRILLLYTALSKLTTLPTMKECIENPDGQLRKELLEKITKFNEISAQIKREKEEMKQIEKESKMFKKNLKKDLKKLNKDSENYSDEEFFEALAKLEEKYHLEPRED